MYMYIRQHNTNTNLMEDILELYNIFVVDGPSKHQRWHGTSKGEGGFHVL